MSRTRAPPRTPPSDTQLVYVEESTETPGPVRAQLNHLKRQVNDLVRNEHNATRKHVAQTAALEQTIAALQAEAKDAIALKKSSEMREAELKRLREEGEKMREELNLHSVIAQQKALLAVATEQLKIVELEQRLVQAEAARLMRDHKIALFRAREADLEAELAEKDAMIQALEINLQAAASRSSEQTRSEIEDAQSEISCLRTKAESLETKLRASKDRERELKAELDSALTDTKNSGSDEEKRDLQKALREAKNLVEQKQEEIVEVQEELASVKEASKQREQTLKAKVKEAAAERDRLLGIEEELAGLRASKSRTMSPTVADKPVVAPVKVAQITQSFASESESTTSKAIKKRKPIDSDEEAPYKPITKEKTLVKSKSISALRETSGNERQLLVSKPKTKLPSVTEESKAEPEKKKKRKLGASVNPVFEWDPVMQSGDGVIPAYLSPARPMGKTVGTIPRAGFKTMTSSRNLSKLL